LSSGQSEDVYKAVVSCATRKLSYRKDDRAMRTMYGCHGNFRESL